MSVFFLCNPRALWFGTGKPLGHRRTYGLVEVLVPHIINRAACTAHHQCTDPKKGEVAKIRC